MSKYSVFMDFIYDETIKMLANVTNAPVTGSQYVLPFYSPKGPVGIKDVNTDTVFYNVVYRDDETNKQMDTEFNVNSDPTVGTYKTTYNRTFRVDWMFCGDDSFEWADTLRLMLFDLSIRSDFASKGISLITDVPEARFAPETIGQKWLHRYDLSVEFNQLVTYQTTIPAISEADVIIETEKGVVSTCST